MKNDLSTGFKGKGGRGVCPMLSLFNTKRHDKNEKVTKSEIALCSDG